VFVCCDCCVLSGRGLCDKLITRPEESYRLWCVVVCDPETSRNEEAMTRVGSQRHRKKKISYISNWLRIGADSGSNDTTYLMLLFHQVKCTIKNVPAFREYFLVITLGALMEFIFLSSFLLKFQQILYYLI